MDEKQLVPIDKNEQKEESVIVSEMRETKTEKGSYAIAVIALLILAALVYFFVFKGETDHGYKVEDSNKVIAAQEHPTLKAEKLDPMKVYTLNKAEDRLNNLTVAITKAQFRKDETRLWVHLKNDGSQKINMMPNVNATLIDNNGHSYKAHPFSGKTITGVAPGVDEDVMLTFDAIRADAKQIVFHLDMIFDMNTPAWQVTIPVEIP